MSTQTPSACGLSRNNIEAIAEDAARHFGYQPGGSLSSFVEELGGALVYEFSGSIEGSGSIVIEPDGFEIRLPHHTGPLRDRFTIAHELGHWFLHYLGAGAHKNGVKMVAQRYGAGLIETEANWFAAAFLMPKDEFRSQWEKCNGNGSAVARYFRVSEAATDVRADSLELKK